MKKESLLVETLHRYRRLCILCSLLFFAVILFIALSKNNPYPYFREIVHPFTLYLIKPSSEFNSLEEEYTHLQKQLSFFDLHSPLSPFMPPAFRALKDDEETHRLEDKYRVAHRRLIKMYRGKDFLQVTLKQFLNR